MDDDNRLFGLAFGCPALQREDDCPLKMFDSFQFKEGVVQIENLSREKKEMILEHHRICSKKLESTRTGKV